MDRYVRGLPVLAGLPILKADIRRVAEATGMDADGVAVVPQPGAIHLLQVGVVAGWPQAGSRRWASAHR